MKKSLFLSIVFTVFLVPLLNAQNGAAVNTSGAAADPSAILDVSSSGGGFLLPRMSSAERNAIQNPAEALQIYNTTTKCFEYFAEGAWRKANCVFTCGQTVSFNYSGAPVTYGSVTGANETCWLDRNLGANSVATSVNHSNGYGHLFQWGRAADGHQMRNSSTTTAISASPTTGHANFIVDPNSPFDWINPQDNNLWQGSAGVNNPCPSGWRLPTDSELESERLTWSGMNITGAFNSVLKLPAAGFRKHDNGALSSEGTHCILWSSTYGGSMSRSLFIFSGDAYMSSNGRVYGFSLRCIRDY